MKKLFALCLFFLFALPTHGQEPELLHLVQPGDTLGTLSRQYGHPPEVLREANEWKRVEECEVYRIPPRNREHPPVRRRSLEGSRSGKPSARALNADRMRFGSRLTLNQKMGIQSVVRALEVEGFQVRADDVAAFMALETGGTFDPAVRSQGRSNGPVGLAQFTEVALREMNRYRTSEEQLSLDGLAVMTFEEQSLVVAEYLTLVFKQRKVTTPQITGHDLYAAVFAPKAVGQPESFPLYTRERDGGAYTRNSSLDSNKDGVITKAEMAARFDVWAGRGDSLRG